MYRTLEDFDVLLLFVLRMVRIIITLSSGLVRVIRALSSATSFDRTASSEFRVTI